MVEIIELFKEGVDAIKEAGGEAYKYCYQCGICDSVCPWNRVTKFSLRRIVRESTFGVPSVEGEEIWRCTTCGRCLQKCPRGVETIKVGVAVRRIASEAGATPAPIHTVSASLGAEGNPMREQRKNRGEWAKDLNVKTFTEGTEYLYFPGCYLSYDSRLKKVAAATVKVLQKAGVDFGLLGSEVVCCGESVRKAGDEALFKQLARENIKAFIDHGVKKIIVSSPHCYQAFKTDYAEFKVNFEVIHITQFLYDLVKKGKLKLEKSISKTMTYHDPCYLGRHNGIYEEPRAVLKSVPGVRLVEMADNNVDSLCCGGGGGGIWMDRKKGERFSDLRVEQAVNAGAQTLVTACPYCIVNFEDSRLSLPNGESFEIKDITEVIQDAI